jgi:hypothetical protein
MIRRLLLLILLLTLPLVLVACTGGGSGTLPGFEDDDDSAPVDDDDGADDDDDGADDDDDGTDDDDIAPDDDDVVLPDDDDIAPDDDDIAPDDDDVVLPDCPLYFVKGIAAASVERWTWNGASFDGPTLHDPPIGGVSWGVVSGDFDGDGDQDFITSGGQNSTYAAHLYDSLCDGNFDVIPLEPLGFTFPGYLQDLHAVGDVDGDGDLDVLGWQYYDGVGTTWLNDGTGQGWTTLDVGADGAVPFALATWNANDETVHTSVATPLADVTGDGLLDLVECHNTGSGDTTCEVQSGDGDGTFSPAPAFTISGIINGFAFADFTGDNMLDLIAGLDDDGDAGQAWLYPMDSVTGTWASTGTAAFDVEPGIESGNDNPGYGWMYPYDWNEDGHPDLVATVMEPFYTGDHTLHAALSGLSSAGDIGWTATEIGSTDGANGSNSGTLVQTSIGVPVFP